MLDQSAVTASLATPMSACAHISLTVQVQTARCPAPPEDLCATQIQRLHRVVELLEQLAQPGLPTLLSTFYRSGDFTAHHKTFHDHPSTAEFPRVGN